MLLAFTILMILYSGVMSITAVLLGIANKNIWVVLCGVAMALFGSLFGVTLWITTKQLLGS